MCNASLRIFYVKKTTKNIFNVLKF